MKDDLQSEQKELGGSADTEGDPARTQAGAVSGMPSDAQTPQALLASLYRSILGRDPDHAGFCHNLELIEKGSTLKLLVEVMLQSREHADVMVKTASFFDAALRNQDFVSAFSTRVRPAATGLREDRFPENYVGNAEAGKFYHAYRTTGLLEKFLSGEKVLDVGYKGYDNPGLFTIVPHAIGVDLDYPGYDGDRLPFDDATIDTVYSSHCLEHIVDYRRAIQEWYRVLKIGGYIVCAVPSQLLYEKKRSLPSRYNGDHKRFYSPVSLIREFEESLEENSFRFRYLEENDKNYSYDFGPEKHSLGCYEIVVVVEKIRKPGWTLE